MKNIENLQTHLYLRLSENIENKINTEALKIGDKLPSVRVLQKEFGVSMSTVLQAYYNLEAKGLIEARPQSGYYVRFSPKKMLAEPQKSSPVINTIGNPAEEILDEVYSDLSDREKTGFALGVPSFELLPVSKLNKSIMEAVRKTPYGGVGYETIKGNENLRRQIAKWSMLWGGHLAPDDIITTTGCMDALALSLAAVTTPGSTIAIESPCFFSIIQLAGNMGLKIIEIPTHPSTGVDPDALKKAISTHKLSAVVLMSNFSNPLGCCIPDNVKKEITLMLEKHNIPLIEDDIYGDIHFSKNRQKNCKTYDESSNVLWCGSFSKTIAPGYRVGWVAPGKYREKVNRLKLYREVSSTTLQQSALAIFLENGRYEHHLRKLRITLENNYMQYARTITENFPESTRISRPQGGLFMWVELDKNADTYELYKKAIKEGISIAPGRMFTLKDQFNNCMRLSYGLHWNPKVEDALKRLGELSKK
jgi:DNA-binding transcriptional MocR family regulator